MKRIAWLLACMAVLWTAHAKSGFAIVIDPVSYDKARAEVEAYASAVETVNGLKPFIVVDRWGIPDSIRACLVKMHASKTNPVIGAVFVGDIPVPMVRDAQHLTSAFKMNQKLDRKESSVPSDRFYDDFGLKFNYVGKDDDAPYFYYSLRGDSEQEIDCDIFSGRIRPTDAGGTSRYDKLRLYLRKAVAAKHERNVVDQLMYFTGNGSLSESTVATIDEKATYYEHFPWLQKPGQSISYIDFNQDRFIKTRLMNELMRPELDFAMLHHHGDWNTQFLSSPQLPRRIEDAKVYIQEQLRSSIRNDRNKDKLSHDSLIARYAAKYGVPVEWLKNTFDKAVVEADSARDARLDLHLEDFAGYGFVPNCRYVMFDACYNGAFHREDCIANEYIFGSGKTVAVIGGSVNVLQDKWYDKYAGLLGLGMYVGYLNQYQQYLESHVIGDPTFSFTPAVKTVDINALIANYRDKSAAKQLKKLVDSPLPDVQALAMELLDGRGEMTSARLLKILGESPYAVVRLQALQLLARHGDDNFVTGVALAMNDRREMVQRFAVNYARRSGDRRLVAPLMALFVANNTSARVEFNVEQDFMFYSREALMQEFERQFAPKICIEKDSVHQRLVKKIDPIIYFNVLI